MAFNAGEIEATLTLNRNPFTAGLAAARNQAKGLERSRFTVTITPRFDRDAMQRIRTTIERTVGRITIRPSLDREAFERIRNTINRTVGRVTIRPNLDRAVLERIRTQIGRGLTVDVKVRIDRDSFQLMRAVLQSWHPVVDVRVRYDRASLQDLINNLRDANNAADRGAASFGRFGDSGGRAFRHVNGAARAVLITLPLLLPVAGAAITGIIGLVGALTAAFVTAGLGAGAFALVGTSVFNSINKAASATAGQSAAAVAAMGRVDTARKSLARTITTSAAQEEAAAERVEDAEQALISAQRNAVRSQEDLNRARKDAVEELEDLQLALRGAALSEEQAVLNLEEAQLRFNEALAEGVSGNELKQLELDVRQAALAVDETRERYGDLRAESDEFARSGIEGSQGVRDAQERLNDANAAVADAEKNLSRARQDQAQIEMENRLAILEAQNELRDAQKAYAMETAAGAVVMSAAMNRAVEALKGVKAEYDALVRRTQDPVADAFTANFLAAQQFLKTLDPLVTSTAEAFRRIGVMANEYFGSPHWRDFVTLLSNNMVPIMTKLFEIIAYGTRIVFNLTEAFMPMAQWLLGSIVDGLKGMATETENLSGDARFAAWVETAKESLKRFWEFLVSVVRFIFEFSYAMAPLGTAIFDVLSKIFNGLSRMPPEWLNGIALGLGAIFSALLLGASGPVALTIGVILGIAAALGTLYSSNENVRKSIDDTVNSLRTGFAPIWKTISDNFEQKILPAWNSLVDVVVKYFEPALKAITDKAKDLLPPLNDLADTIFGKLIPALLGFLEHVAPFIASLVQFFGPVLLHILEGAVRIFDGALQIIAGLINTFVGLFQGDWEKMGEGLKGISDGFWTIIAGIFGMSLEDLRTVMQEWDRNINNDWATMWGGIITEQDGSQREVDGKWNQFWGKLKADADAWEDGIWGDWNQFWTDTKTTADTWEDNIWGSWNQFWVDSYNNANKWEADLWGGWNGFWTDTFNTANEWEANLWGAWNTFFGNLWGTISRWWGDVITGWNNFWTGVWQGVVQATTNLGNAWNRIHNLFRDPMQWVIDVVLNNGILGAWNIVMDWIEQPQLGVAPIPPLPRFASGGPVKGGIPNKDSVPIMTMPGEYVLSKRAVENIGGVNKVEMMHQAARSGRLTGLGAGRADGLARQHLMRAVPADDAYGRAYAYGGVQPHVAAAGQEIERLFGRMPGGIGGVGARSNKSDHPSGHALDFMTLSNTGLGNRIASHFIANAQRLMMKYIIWQQQINQGAGWRGMEDRGSPTANHMDHPHVSFLRAGQTGNPFSGAGGVAMEPVSWWSLLAGPVTSLFNGLIPQGIPGIGGPIGGAMLKVPGALIGKVIEGAKAKLEKLFTDPFGLAGGSKNASAGMAKGPVVDQVRAVAARYGWDQGAQWNDLSALIQKESSWNPNAANPTSSARGLFQKMTSIHGPIEPTPAGQAQWGLNYIRGRYGSPSAAWAFHRRNNWYENGGWLMPGESAYNETREPEAIFNRPQLSAIHRAIDGPGSSGSRDGLSADEIRTIVQEIVNSLGGDTYNVMLPERATIRELANEMSVRKRVAAKGRYCPK